LSKKKKKIKKKKQFKSQTLMTEKKSVNANINPNHNGAFVMVANAHSFPTLRPTNSFFTYDLVASKTTGFVPTTKKQIVPIKENATTPLTLKVIQELDKNHTLNVQPSETELGKQSNNQKDTVQTADKIKLIKIKTESLSPNGTKHQDQITNTTEEKNQNNENKTKADEEKIKNKLDNAKGDGKNVDKQKHEEEEEVFKQKHEEVLKNIPLSNAAESFIFSLEPEVSHISKVGFNYFVVEITNCKLKKKKNLNYVADANMTHWYLWSSLCHEANLLRAALEEKNRTEWSNLYKINNYENQKFAAMRGGLVPLIKEKEQWLEGTLPARHIIKKVLMKIYKRNLIYVLVRVQGKNCIYDTFYPEHSVAQKVDQSDPAWLKAPFVHIDKVPWDSFDPTLNCSEDKDNDNTI
jgi:hypothetical protein